VRDVRPERLHFLIASPTDLYFIKLALAVDVTVLAILPLVAYQLVVAGFPQIRRGSAAAVGLTTAACFAGGAAFGWFVIFPSVLDHLVRSQSDFVISLTLPMYLNLASLTVLAAGVVCSLPAVYALGTMRLASARWIVCSWAAATAAIAIATALAGDPHWPLLAEVAALLLLCYVGWMLVRLGRYTHRSH
jgi:Sec-independent protein secretion pathway component TatC